MGFPKALAQFNGRPLLEHLLEPPLLRQFGDVVVVLGHHADALEPLVKGAGYRYVVNSSPDCGRTGSVQAGLSAIGPGIHAVFIQPVDCPIVAPQTYTAVAGAVGSAEVVVPSFGGRGGHPPLISRELFSRILAVGPDEPLRNVLRAPGVRRRYVEVDDPGVLVNVDRPGDLQQLTDLVADRDKPDAGR